MEKKCSYPAVTLMPPRRQPRIQMLIHDVSSVSLCCSVLKPRKWARKKKKVKSNHLFDQSKPSPHQQPTVYKSVIKSQLLGRSNKTHTLKEKGDRDKAIKNYAGEPSTKLSICVWKGQLGLHRKRGRKENSSHLPSGPAPQAYQAFYLLSRRNNLI